MHKNTKNGVQLPFDDLTFVNKWQEWLQYRKERRIAAYAPTGLKQTFKKLLADSRGDVNVAIAIIDQSIALSWQGLFPLKNVNNGNSKGPITNAGIKDAIIGFVNGRK